MLAFYADHFETVEINNSFYQLPSEKALAEWRDTVPDDFVFAAKASRYITHMKKLKDAREAVATFIEAHGGLGDKLGPVLFSSPRAGGSTGEAAVVPRPAPGRTTGMHSSSAIRAGSRKTSTMRSPGTMRRSVFTISRGVCLPEKSPRTSFTYACTDPETHTRDFTISGPSRAGLELSPRGQGRAWRSTVISTTTRGDTRSATRRACCGCCVNDTRKGRPSKQRRTSIPSSSWRSGKTAPF